jgi:hypothetical protein
VIGRRSLLSLSQLFELIPYEDVRIICEKHRIEITDLGFQSGPLPARFFLPALEAADRARLVSVVDEIVRTQGDTRARSADEYRFDERFADLRACLELDGYTFRKEGLHATDPAVEDVGLPIEDDLISALTEGALPRSRDVVDKLTDSANSFRRTPPNYNACLNDARVALQTLMTEIADRRRARVPGTYDATKFGQVLAYLRSTGFVDEVEEKQIASVFGFLSRGSHRAVGPSEQEMARLGRSLACSICWFLVKLNAADTA